MKVLLIDSLTAERDARAAALRAHTPDLAVASTAAEAASRPGAHVVVLRARATREALASELEALRRSEAYRAAPIIVLGQGVGHAMTALTAGADDFWEEPLDGPALAHAFHALQASRAPHPGGRSSKPLILVADDDKFFRERTADALRACGCEAETIASGAELLKRLDGPRPALLVIDVFMPGLGGQELLTRLAEHPRWRVVPTVMMSAVREDPAFEAALKRLGARAFVAKSTTDVDALVEVVREQVSPTTLVRRRAPRAATHGLASFRATAEEPWLTSFVYNLGPTGAFLRTTVPCAEDTMVHVRLEVPHGGTRVTAIARVAWSRSLSAGPDDFYGMGVQFNDLSSEARRALEDMIALHPVAPS